MQSVLSFSVAKKILKDLAMEMKKSVEQMSRTSQ